MKALETEFDGYRFRSRTEARWAVALKAASIEFEYEPQGFDLPSGWYLPDFWLPAQSLWLEVKGQEPNERELAVAADLARGSGHSVLIAVGPPNPDRDYLSIVSADGVLETRFILPTKAYDAARAARFDGKPEPAKRPEKRRWW